MKKIILLLRVIMEIKDICAKANFNLKKYQETISQ